MPSLSRTEGRQAPSKHRLLRQSSFLLRLPRLLGPPPEQVPELQIKVHYAGPGSRRAARELTEPGRLLDGIVQFLREGHLSNEQAAADLQEDVESSEDNVWVELWRLDRYFRNELSQGGSIRLFL